MSTQNFTPHDGVNQILSVLLEKAKTILTDQFVGMYLYGSLSSGDFHPDASDIDFLIRHPRGASRSNDFKTGNHAQRTLEKRNGLGIQT
ncbi:nucleotidyltransferase domain-containing protein [Candidatus Villigracilis affinis]|uniref:nucleotidyltransferase domain-containing protein n=1 Tax=Candidatus Villigracilis affinis TaxID=3140682 RepID=UPI002A20B725|nr:nucleotidyltransferase domain-containing protein [Anaerolineales bacterium]